MNKNERTIYDNDACAYDFDEQTADGYDDLLSLFADIPDALGKLLSRYGIIEED